MALYGSLHALLPFFSPCLTLSPCVNVSICETFVMNGWGKREDREMWAAAPLGSAKAKKKEKRMSKGCVCGWVCMCARVCGCWGMCVHCIWTAYKRTNMHSALHLCPHWQGCRVCMNLCVCVCGWYIRVQGRDGLNLYSWSVPRRD